MRAQNVELVLKQGHPLVTRPREEVACVGVAGHEAQRLLLSRTADHDARARRRDWQWLAEGLRKLIVLANERAYLARPHLVGDLQRLLQALEALAEGRECHAKGKMFALIPARPDPEPGSAAGEHVERRHRLDQNPGMAIGHARDQRAE